MKAQNFTSAIKSETTLTSPNDYLEDILSKLSTNDPSLIKIDLREINLTIDELEKLKSKVQDNPFVGHIDWGTHPLGSDKLLKDIEEKIILNNKNYKPYPNDFMHGLFSAHVYQDSEGKEKVELESSELVKYNEYLKDWRIHKVFSNMDEAGYYGTAYINDKTKQIVLAHRGTLLGGWFQNDSPIRSDIHGILQKNMVAQISTSYTVIKEISSTAKVKSYNLSITGHSLGAWLAELTTYFCHIDFNYSQVKAVTFDSPGSGEQISKLKPNITTSAGKSNIKNIDVTVYLSAPNFVNSCNKHIGNVYTLSSPPSYNADIIKQKLPKGGWITNKIIEVIEENRFLLEGIVSITGHSLNPLLKKFDPVTGKPQEYQEVVDWPVIAYKVAPANAEKAIIEKIINSVPFLNIFSGPLAEIFSNVLHTTAGSIINVLADLIQSNINSSQYFNTYKNLIKLNVDNPQHRRAEFALWHEAHYKVQELNSQIPIISNTNGIDWYLIQLNSLTIDNVNKISDLVKTQLTEIKKSYSLKYSIFSRDIVIETEREIEDLRNHLSRVLKSSEEAKNILENNNSSNSNSYIFTNLNKTSKIINSTLQESLPNNLITRRGELDKIDKILEADRFVVISALPGAGKSTLAEEYGCRQRDRREEKKIVLFINAASPEEISKAYIALAENLDIKAKTKTEETLRSSVHKEISTLKSSVLFIFDNVTNYNDIKPYLNGIRNITNNKVQAIITTQNSELNDNLTKIKLEPFSNEEATSYLNKSLEERGVTSQEIKDLIKKLNALPYSLSQAAEYLKRHTEVDVSTYINSLAVNQNDKVEKNLIFKLFVDSPIAWQILQYSAYLDINFISIDILIQLFSRIKKELGSEEELVNVIEKLQASSIIEKTNQNKNSGVKLTELVQNTVRKYVDNHQDGLKIKYETKSEVVDIIKKKTIYKNLSEVLDQLFLPITTVSGKEREKAEILYSHVVEILSDTNKDKIDNNKVKVSLYKKLGNYEYISCRFEESLKYYKKALDITKALNITIASHEGRLHSDTAAFFNIIGGVYKASGNPTEALANYKQALEMYQELYKGKHADIALSLNNIGRAHQTLGNTQKALDNYTQALEMYQALFNDQKEQDYSQGIALSLNNIGRAHQTLGNTQKALANYTQALEMYQELYKGKHADIALSLNNIGWAYQTLGNTQKALANYKQALEMYQELSKEQDYSQGIAASFNNIGWAYRTLGKPNDALDNYKKALEKYQELYTKGKHADIATSFNNIGWAYQALRNLNDALDNYKKALEIYQELYPDDDHLDIATSFDNIGAIHKALGNKQEVLDNYKQALKIRQKLQPSNHGDIALSLNNVAYAYQILEQKKEACTFYNFALKRYNALHNDVLHPDIANSFDNIGAMYKALREPKKALIFYEKSLKIRQDLYLGAHPDIATSLHKIADVYKALGDNNKFQELYIQAYIMCQKTSGSNNPDIENMKKFINDKKNGFKEIKNNPTREFILHKGNSNDLILEVKKVLQEKDVLNNIYKEATKDNWSSSFLYYTKPIIKDWGVNGYINKEYLKTCLAKLYKKDNEEEIIEIAQMLCFEAMNLGTMSVEGNKKYRCVKEFQKNYSEVVKKIIKINPEYFVDGSILRQCIIDPESIKELLGNNNHTDQEIELKPAKETESERTFILLSNDNTTNTSDNEIFIPWSNNKNKQTACLFKELVIKDINTIKSLIADEIDIKSVDSNNQIALHSAIRFGKYKVVELFLEKGADVKATNYYDQTALHLATREGKYEIVELLLKNGANIEAKDWNGETALHYASVLGNPEIVNLLLKNGANIEAKDWNGDTALHYASVLGNPEIVNLLLKNGANIEAKNWNGDTALHYASRLANSIIFSVLIGEKINAEVENQEGKTASHGAEIVLHLAANDSSENVKVLPEKRVSIKATNQAGETALHEAARGDSFDIVKQLLENGADVNVTNQLGETALHLAANGSSEIVEVLLEYGANVKVINQLGDTALHLAARQGKSEIVKLLLKYDATKIKAANQLGETALHLAANGSSEVVKLLLAYGADVNVTNQAGDTALHLAAREDKSEIVKLLLGKGTKIKAKDHEGDTVWQEAIKSSNVEFIERLLYYKVYKAYINAPNKTGDTALHLAVNGSSEVVQLLLEHDARNIDARNYQDETALHLATSKNKFKIVNLLLKHKATIDAKDQFNETALHLAATQRNYNIVKLLLEYRADINATNHVGDTALHLAVNGSSEVVQLLLEYGADINKINHAGDTALHLAAIQGKSEIVQLLKDHKVNIEATSQKDETALHLTAIQAKSEIVELSLEKGAKIEATSQKDETALHLPTIQGKSEIVELSLKKGAKIDATNQWGETALHLATYYNKSEIVKLLLEYGADINATNQWGETALHYSCIQDNSEIVKLLLKHDKINIEAKDQKKEISCWWGETALHWAVRFNKFEIVKLLLEYGADINATNYAGDTALHLATIKGKYVVELLLEKGAKIDAKNQAGETALYLADIYGKYEIVELLRDHKANIEVTSQKDETALHLATREGNSEVDEEKLLISEISSQTMSLQEDALPSDNKNSQRTIPKGFIDVKGDGLCFYHAISSLLNNKYSAQTLQAKAIDHIRKNPNNYSQGSLQTVLKMIEIPGFDDQMTHQECIEAYIKYHERSNNSADYVTIKATANALGMTINVLMFNSNGTPITYRQMKEHAGEQVVMSFIPDQGLVVGNLNNSHFVAQKLSTAETEVLHDNSKLIGLESSTNASDSITSDNRTNQIKIPKGFVDVKGDGLCFYHAISKQLNDEYDAQTLQAKAIDHIRKNPNGYNTQSLKEFLKGFREISEHNINQMTEQECIEAYIKHHEKSNNWADQGIIQATANALGMTINVPMFNLDGTPKIHHKGEHVGKQEVMSFFSDQGLVVGKLGDNHFVAQKLSTAETEVLHNNNNINSEEVEIQGNITLLNNDLSKVHDNSVLIGLESSTDAFDSIT